MNKLYKRNILITGGAGFIGNHVVRLFVNKYPDYRIVNLDKLTYAGNLANLKDIEKRDNYVFVKADIADLDEMRRVFAEYMIDGVIHLAAESHVDRSIKDPFTFARTNVMGTLALLQAARERWESLPEGYAGKLFYHISTDEVTEHKIHGSGCRIELQSGDSGSISKERTDRAVGLTAIKRIGFGGNEQSLLKKAGAHHAADNAHSVDPT